MEKIASFTVDHTKLKEGVYVSRLDGDIVTYDLRMRRPNSGDILNNVVIHSFEHLFATLVRNSAMGEQVIYFGPMGCQTGFYLLLRGDDSEAALTLIKKTLVEMITYPGKMPGASREECGNYLNLSIHAAKDEAERYYEKIKELTVADMIYEG